MEHEEFNMYLGLVIVLLCILSSIGVGIYWIYSNQECKYFNKLNNTNYTKAEWFWLGSDIKKMKMLKETGKWKEKLEE